MNKGWVVVLALPAIAGMLWIATKNNPDEQSSARPMSPEKPAEEALIPPSEPPPMQKTQAASVATVAPVVPKESTEIMPTKDLQALLDKDPAAALVIARRDLAKDPKSPDAAERNWVVVKSLAVLGRYEEAKREAEVMVPKYRDTRWANDIERHILAHP